MIKKLKTTEEIADAESKTDRECRVLFSVNLDFELEQVEPMPTTEQLLKMESRDVLAQMQEVR